ncbi:MAG: DUF3006 family protein [Myxococcota bacterium]
MRHVGLAATFWLSCGTTREVIQIELLEDEVAQVVRLESGQVESLPRSALPPSAKEGDVVVDGVVDRQRTAQARRQVRKVRAKAFAGKSTPALTDSRER